MRPSFTIGIEEEYQTVDPVSRDLRSHIHAEIIEKGKLLLQERVKSEMHQSVVEVGTSVCGGIKEAKEEIKKLRRDMSPANTLFSLPDIASPLNPRRGSWPSSRSRDRSSSGP